MVSLKSGFTAFQHLLPGKGVYEEYHESEHQARSDSQVYDISSEDEGSATRVSSISRSKGSQKKPSLGYPSAAEESMALGQDRRPVRITPSDPSLGSDNININVERRSESTRMGPPRPRGKPSASGISSPFNNVGRDTLDANLAGPAQPPRSAYGRSQSARMQGPAPSLSAGSRVAIRHTATPSFVTQPKETAPIDFYGNETPAAIANYKASNGKSRPTGSYDPAQPTLSFGRKEDGTRNIKGSAALRAAQEGASKTNGVRIKGNADRTRNIGTIEIDSDEEKTKPPQQDDVDSIEAFSDDEHAKASRGKQPTASSNSAQRVIPAGTVDRAKQSYTKQPTRTLEKPPPNNGNESGDDLQFLPDMSKRPSQHGKMKSKAQQVESAVSERPTRGNGSGKGKQTATAVRSLPVASFCYKGHTLKNLQMVVHPAREPANHTIKFTGSALDSFSFKLGDIQTLLCPLGGTEFMIVTLTPDIRKARTEGSEHNAPQLYLHFDVSDPEWTKASTIYNEVLNVITDLCADVRYVTLAAFTSIREAAYPSRPSRSQSQHKAAEAAEARKRGELSARSAALPNAIASNRVKARPTAGAKAAEIRLRETDGKSNGPTAAFTTTSTRRDSRDLQEASTSTAKPVARCKSPASSSESDAEECPLVARGPIDGRKKEQKARESTLRSADNAIPAKDKGKGRLVDDGFQPEAEPFVRFVPEHQTVLVYPRDETGSVSITNGDLNRLAPGEYLNDTLVEFGMKRIWRELRETDPELSEQIHIFSSFFYKKLTEKDRRNKGDPYESVKKWTSKFDLFKKKYIILPINENFHWYLAIIVNPGWIIDPRAAERKAKEVERNQTRKATARKSTGKPTKRRIPQSDDEMNETDKDKTQEPARSKNMSLSPDPPSPPSRDLSPTGAKELEKNASHKPASSASSTFSKATSTSEAREIVATSVQEKAGKTESSGEMEVDSTMNQTSEAAESSAVKISRDDRCFIITFDSLGGAHTAVYATLKNYLKSEAKDKKGLDEDKVFIDKENCRGTSAKVPEQPNGCDCGLYVMHFAEIFLRKASQVLACFEKERKLSQTQKEVDSMWDSAGALKRRSALLADMLTMSKEWKIWAEEKEAEKEAARTARRLAKASKAAQASDTEMQDGDALSTEAAGTDISSEEESGDDSIEIVKTKRKSPTKSPQKRKSNRAGPASSQADDDSSQQTVKPSASAAESRATSPGHTVTSQRISSPDTAQRQKPASRQGRAPSPSKNIFVEVELPSASKSSSRPSTDAMLPGVNAQAAIRKPAASKISRKTEDAMDVDARPSPAAKAGIESVDLDESDESSTEKSDSEDSDAGPARNGRVQQLAREQPATRAVGSLDQSLLAQGMESMAVDQSLHRSPPVPDPTYGRVPLTERNSRHCEASGGDDSFAYSVPVPSQLSAMSDDLFAAVREGVAAGDAISRKTSDLRNRYSAQINHGNQPLPSSPAQHTDGHTPSSPAGLIGTEVAASPQKARVDLDRGATTSKYFTGESSSESESKKRKRASSIEVAPSHSQEQSSARKAKRARAAAGFGDEAPISVSGSKGKAVAGSASSAAIVEISDDDLDKSAEHTLPDSQIGKATVTESSEPSPFPAQPIGSGSASPKQKHGERPPSNQGFQRPTSSSKGTHTIFRD